MKRRFVIRRDGLLVVLAVILCGGSVAKEATADAADEAGIARGAYLVTLGGCDDCHTPKVMGPHGPRIDETRRLSGHPEGETIQATELGEGWVAATNEHLTVWQGPWGRTYARNLTPDQDTGIGAWSEETFTQAIRTGKHMGNSRPIMPPMPWENYARMTDEDLHAVWLFLRSLPPISNQVPAFEPAPMPEGDGEP